MSNSISPSSSILSIFQNDKISPNIVKWFTSKDVYSCMQVSRLWNQVFHSDNIWKIVCQNQLGETLEKDCKTYYSNYRKLAISIKKNQYQSVTYDLNLALSYPICIKLNKKDQLIFVTVKGYLREAYLNCLDSKKHILVSELLPNQIKSTYSLFCFNDEATSLIATFHNSICVYDVETTTLKKTKSIQQDISLLDVFQDKIATSDQKSIHVWNLNTLELLHNITVNNTISDLQLTKNTIIFYCVSHQDQTQTIWASESKIEEKTSIPLFELSLSEIRPQTTYTFKIINNNLFFSSIALGYPHVFYTTGIWEFKTHAIQVHEWMEPSVWTCKYAASNHCVFMIIGNSLIMWDLLTKERTPILTAEKNASITCLHATAEHLLIGFLNGTITVLSAKPSYSGA